MRISVCDWATDDDDVDRAIEALLRHAKVHQRPPAMLSPAGGSVVPRQLVTGRLQSG